MYQDNFATFFEDDYLTKCNQFGRFPILPLSTHIADGNISDDASSCSPVTPLDAFAFSFPAHFQQQAPYCMPMSDLYIHPPSDIDSLSSPSPSPEPSPAPAVVVPSQKRESPSPQPAPTAAKKPRIAAERVRAKDFIPPDTSGLTKREARLVKNRAAAFLSRQRKREEFEAMEARLAELERENARLVSGAPAEESQLAALRQRLADSTERVEHLQKELALAQPGLAVLSSLSTLLHADALSLCDPSSGEPAFDVSCAPIGEGKARVRIHRAQGERDPFLDELFDCFPRPVRVTLGKASIHDDGAEIEVSIQ